MREQQRVTNNKLNRDTSPLQWGVFRGNPQVLNVLPKFKIRAVVHTTILLSCKLVVLSFLHLLHFQFYFLSVLVLLHPAFSVGSVKGGKPAGFPL
jgi:hypothetical protein